MAIQVICPQCGHPFQTFPSHLGKRKYCSRACKGAMMRGKPFYDSSGKPPWNKGTHGLTTSWNRGKTGIYSEEALQRMHEAGLQRTGDRHPRWKGGRRAKRGYVEIFAPDHPHCTANQTVLEHRLVMEQTLRRLLAPEEVVHHINGVKDDNRPENLALFSSNKEHMKGHKGLGRPRKPRSH